MKEKHKNNFTKSILQFGWFFPSENDYIRFLLASLLAVDSVIVLLYSLGLV